MVSIMWFLIGFLTYWAIYMFLKFGLWKINFCRYVEHWGSLRIKGKWPVRGRIFLILDRVFPLYKLL